MSSPPFAVKLSSHLRPYSSSCRVKEASRTLNYPFVSAGLLEEALTHPSCLSNADGAGNVSYERKELLGDVALNLAMTKHFYLSHPELGPGMLSKLRAANLCNENLARVVVWHGLHRLIRHNCPELDKQVEEFTKAVMQGPEQDQIHNGKIEKAPKVLADVVEAIAAAVYEDCNFNLDVIWKIFRRLLEPLITVDTLDKKPAESPGKQFQKSDKIVDDSTGQ